MWQALQYVALPRITFTTRYELDMDIQSRTPEYGPRRHSPLSRRWLWWPDLYFRRVLKMGGLPSNTAPPHKNGDTSKMSSGARNFVSTYGARPPLRIFVADLIV